MIIIEAFSIVRFLSQAKQLNPVLGFGLTLLLDMCFGCRYGIHFCLTKLRSKNEDLFDVE